MFRITAFTLTVTIFTACGALDLVGITNSDQDPISKKRIVLFTASDVTFSSSQLFQLSYEQQPDAIATVSAPILSGSGDMVLFESEGRLFVFNRKGDDLNFRQLRKTTSDDAVYLKLGKQRSIPSAEAGDPHDILVIDDTAMMLANYNKGEVVVINYKTGKLIQVVTADWDLPGDSPLRPESLYRLKDGRVAVLHQGYDSRYQLNDSQQLFLIERTAAGKWQAVDLDDETDSDEGIKLRVNVPQRLFGDQDDETILYTAGVCSSSAEDCTSGIEQIDVDDRKSNLTVDITDDKLFYYGPPVAADQSSWVMSLQHGIGDEKQIKLSLLTKDSDNAETLFDYPNKATSGYWGYAVDDANNLLFIGDPGAKGQGRLIVYDLAEQRELHEFTAPMIPYSMLTIAPEAIVD